MMKRIWALIRCHALGDHRWTSKAQQGIQPSADELADGMKGFERFARMFCADCGYTYTPEP